VSTWYRARGLQLIDTSERTDALRAISYFDQALRWQPTDPQVYRDMARAYLHLSQPHLAVEALEHAYRLSPESLLIRQELAQTYEAAGRFAQADTLWLALSLTPERMARIGDEYFAKHAYAQAFTWYQRAELGHPTPTHSQLFTHAVAAILANRPESQEYIARLQMGDRFFTVYDLQDSPQIEGRQLRWLHSAEGQLSPGTPLATNSQSTAGIFWWSGQAFVLLHSPRDGAYLVDLRVQHSKPAPIQLAVGADSRQLQTLTLSRGDNSWETVSVPVQLSQGWHTLDIWFLNNGIVDGVDRNAIVDWIQLREGRS
jgi:tetratricopeptide (TPR) repeat protein